MPDVVSQEEVSFVFPWLTCWVHISDVKKIFYLYNLFLLLDILVYLLLALLDLLPLRSQLITHFTEFKDAKFCY